MQRILDGLNNTPDVSRQVKQRREKTVKKLRLQAIGLEVLEFFCEKKGADDWVEYQQKIEPLMKDLFGDSTGCLNWPNYKSDGVSKFNKFFKHLFKVFGVHRWQDINAKEGVFYDVSSGNAESFLNIVGAVGMHFVKDFQTDVTMDQDERLETLFHQNDEGKLLYISPVPAFTFTHTNGETTTQTALKRLLIIAEYIYTKK